MNWAEKNTITYSFHLFTHPCSLCTENETFRLACGPVAQIIVISASYCYAENIRNLMENLISMTQITELENDYLSL